MNIESKQGGDGYVRMLQSKEEVAKRIEGYGEKFSPNWNLGEIRDRIKKTSDVDSKKEKTQIKTLLDRTSVSLKIRPFENEAKALIRIEF